MRGLVQNLAVATVLSGCAIGNAVVEDTSRELAKGVVNGVIAEKLPGVDAEPYTDCIIDNASFEEIVQLAQSAATGGSNAAPLIFEIASRPATTQCLAGNALGAALG